MLRKTDIAVEKCQLFSKTPYLRGIKREKK